MKRPIAISLSPNLEKDDITLAKKILFSPRIWFDQKKVQSLEKDFEKYFGRNFKAVAVNSGRSALYIILKSLEIGKGDEVITQAFTCVAVPNSILWTGAKPVFVDIGDDYNLNLTDLSKKISNKTKAIVVQHTFGIPAQIEKIKKLINNRKIYLIEDCAHSLGTFYQGAKVGSLGDVSFFSFGRDKVISSVFGGMILCSNEALTKSIKKIVSELPNPSNYWVVQQLLHPILFSIILPLYNFGHGKFTIGKFLLFVLQKVKLLSLPIYQKEKIGQRPSVFPQKMSGALASLAANQLKKLTRFSLHRRQIVNLYIKSFSNSELVFPKVKDLSLLRFPIIHSKAQNIYDLFKNNGILLGNWYKGIVQPAINLKSVDFEPGSCPKAKTLSEQIINLPTYPALSLQEATKIVQLIKLWTNTKLKK